MLGRSTRKYIEEEEPFMKYGGMELPDIKTPRKDTLRLICTYRCHRSCVGCCNKQTEFGHDSVKPVEHLDYSSIVLTGGEPLLYPTQLFALAESIRMMSDAKLILYTTKVKLIHTYNVELCNLFDGLTVSIHDKDDLYGLHSTAQYERMHDILSGRGLDMRVNIRTDIEWEEDFEFVRLDPFNVKMIDWKEECPLPTNEEIRRLKHTWR